MTKDKLIYMATILGVGYYKSWTKGRIKDAIDNSLSYMQTAITYDIKHHEKQSGAYFWRPPSTAAARRKLEADRTYARTLTIGGNVYRYESTVTCSCKNYYYRGEFTINGEKRDVRLWKKLLHDLSQIKTA